jgi:hypothetical protein
MDWEARAKQLRVDIPAIYIAMHLDTEWKRKVFGPTKNHRNGITRFLWLLSG